LFLNSGGLVVFGHSLMQFGAKAAALAADAEEKEARGLFGEAKVSHHEAARLFRVSAASVQDESQQQMRALARHHESRAKWCETAEATKVRTQQKTLLLCVVVLSDTNNKQIGSRQGSSCECGAQGSDATSASA
jgi:hypothetical protein